MKKRNLIALLMAVCMMFSLLPVNAIAVGDEGTVPAEETLLSENGNDSAPAGNTNPAGDKESIPDTGEKPSAAEEPVKDEESGKDEEPAKGEEPAKDEEPGKDEEPAEGEEGGKTNVVPMRVVRPDTDKYLTYVFRVDGAEVSRQIVKKGDTLYQPVSPVKDGYKFTGWFVGASELAFGTVGEISESAQINVDAGFTEVLYVFFADTNGRIVHTKEGVKGDVIKTDDVTYGLENTTHAITGWYLEGSYQTPVDSVTLDKENITVYAKVEPGHWLHFDSDGGTYVAPQFYSADATTAAPNVVTKPGYTFSHWEYNGTKFEFGSPLTENITLKARWNAKADTQYTVIHWQEDADDDGYSYVENETLYGTTGAQTSARAKTYNGFTVRAITQETIKGNGATIVNIYYKRNVYEVKFYRRTSGFSGWSEMTQKTISAKYGANIRDKWPGGQWTVSPGGSTCQTNIDVMPLGGASFYETSQYNGSAKYYLEDLNGNYVLDHTDTGASTTATITKEDRYNITGFTVNESKSGKDGERYNGASFYYDRNSYNVVYISHGQTVKTASYKYQQSIADAGNYKLTTPPVGMEKYIFAGWCADPFGLPEYVFDGKTMPAQNITVYAYWAAPTVYGFAHITMEGADGKELTIPYGGTIDESMLPVPQKPAGEGWTFAGWATKNGDTYTPFHFSTKIYENIELYPYYTNKSSYTVTYTDGKDTVTDMKRYASGAHADVQANSFAVPGGKVFLGWNTKADGTGTTYYPGSKIPVTDNLTLYAIWGEKVPTVSLTYNANGGKGGTHVENGYVNNGLVTLWDGSSFSRAGYTLVGWSTDPNAASAEYKTGSTARVDSTGDNILYAVWKANENTAYKVEFYCEQTNGAYTLAKTEPRAGTTDATVSVTDGDKGYGAPTYVYDAANENNVESGIVTADGSLTLKLYFKRNTAEYTIHHFLKGTEVKVAPDQTGTMTIGDTLTASASTALGAEYTSAHVDSYSPSQSLKMKATGNVITVYYTVPLTITAESASRAYNAQPLTQPDFKVEGLVNGDQKTDITLSMTKESTITNVGSVSNVIDTTTVRFKGGELPGGYYELPTYKPGTLTITADETEVVVTITGNHDTRVYNGSEQNVTGFTTDVGEKTITVALKEGSKAEAKGMNAGKYDMGLTKDNFTVTSQNYSNIKVVVVDGYLKIDPITEKVTVTVTEKSDTVTYDGKEHTVTGYKSISADNTLYDVKKNVAETSTEAWTAKGTYVGTYHVGIKAADFKNTSGNFTNVEFVIVDGALKIIPASVAVVKIAGNTKTVTYNGKAQSVEGYTVTSNPANATVTLVGKAVASGTDANTYPMGLTAADFTATSPNYKNVTIEVTDGYLEIDPITDKVTVTVTEKSGSAVYNGQEHSVTGYETMTANNALYDVKKNVAETQTAAWTAKGTDVGEYPVGIVSGDFANTSKNFTNVVFTVVDGALTISPISEKTITVTAASDSKKYDGTPLTNNGFSCTEGVLVPGDVLTAVVEGSATNVGDEGKNVVKSYKVMRGGTDVTGNYTFTDSVDGKLTILPRTVTLTSETASKEYDGMPLTRPDVSVTGDGFVSGEVTGITATGSVTYVSDGTVENTITYTTGAAFREANYEITKIPGQLSITQSSNAIVITTASRSRVYNGEKLLDDQTTHTGTLAEGDRLVVEFPADAGLTDVGTKRNEYKSYRVERSDGADVTANYTFGEPVIGTLTVTPVAIELTANSAAKAYDGTPLTDSGYTISNGSFVGEEGLAGVTVEGSQTAVGSSANTITGHKLKSNTLAKNYTITYANGTLTVTQSEKVITVTANSRTWEYDGQPHSDGGYTVVYDGETYTVAAGESQKLPTGGLTLTATVVGTVKNVADSAKDNNKITVVAITDAAGNVVNDQFKTITLVPGTLTITKRGAGEEKVILKAANNAVVYDGQPHGVCLTADGKVEAGTSYAITYLADGHSVETVITGSRTEVGKYTGILVPDKNNTHIVDGSGNDVTDNYEITYRNGDLEIVAPGTVVVEIKGIRDSVVYDGSKHEVNGYTVVSISNRAYTRADFSLAEGKSAHAEGTNVGEYYMNLKPESFVNNNTQNFTSVQFVIVEDGLLEITPITDEVTVTITGNNDTKVYNGKEQSVTDYTTDVGTKTIDVALKDGVKAEAKGTDVDTYYMGLTKDSFSVTSRNYSNIKVVVNDGWLKIDPIADKVTVTVTENSAAVTYDGTEHSVTGYKSMTADNTLYDVEKNVAEKPTKAWTAKGTDAGEYPVGIVSGDFRNTSKNFTNVEFVIVDGTLKIDPVSDKVTVTVTENSAAVTYDGTEHSVTGYKSMTADNTLYDVEKNVAEKPTKAWTAKGTDAGEYPVGIVSGDFRNTSKNFTNVEFVIVDGTLKIDPVSDKVTVTITENADTVIYDTKEHSVKGYKSMTADNALYDVKKNVAETSTEAWTAKGTDVGEYPVGIKADDFENTSSNFTNVEFVVVDGALKIAPAESIVVKIAGNTKTVTYNGEEQSVEGYTVTSNPANADVTLVGKAVATGTDADTYPMGLTAADFTATSPNYETVVIKVTDGWLKINPVSDKVTVTVTEKSDSVVYDGQEHSVTGYETMAADNALYNTADVAETPTDAWTAKGTNAGKYQVGIKSGDFKNTSVNFTNVAFVIADGELEITPVTDKVTVTVVEKSDNVTYDAAEHSITGYETMTADNALYDIANVAKTPTAAWTAKGTEAGEYPVGIVSGDFKNTSKNFANVEFVIVDGALTITTDDTEVVVTVTGNTKTVVYDGTEHSVEGYTVDVNGLPITVTPKAGTEAKASGTNAGTYYMGLTADDFTAESNNYSNIRIVVTDGWLKIDPITDKVTVTITENADTVEYDGKEHSVTGYASIVSDHALYDVTNVAETPTDAWTAKGTDAGTYPVGIKSGDFRNTSGNFTNVEFVIEDGELVITRRGENPGSPVTLRADDNTVMFDGDYHGYVGHIATNLAEGHSVRSVKSDFTARNVGRYEDKIDLHDAIIVDADGKDVTRNYVLTYQPGTLEITPFEGEVVVTVTGNTGLFRYDGKIHTVEGYTLEATVPFFTEDDIRFTGDATISEVRPGDYVMNLKDEEFSAANDNFTSVKFVVIDGSMRIYTVRYTVAWMFDTDQMLTGDSPNRYFTSMANYIDRSDISLVLHSGNVVADAGAQSQWDVFNNAMQPLYDDEEVDVLMIAAEKEAASGSLFLQQPVREDFKEEDLFENGKGFVRRFNIGEKSVILVGLGADAMTEEGYKWAREKFNSDKDASGILLVNNYLLEDMRKPDKIDERALDLEKNVVKACSNVRMVLSSSGGYSSHYEFYYGERKVIAINSDIEAAAKAGYFTQLTFNEDLNILSVTNLCPYTYDFVYNERQAYKECYVLNNVL